MFCKPHFDFLCWFLNETLFSEKVIFFTLTRKTKEEQKTKTMLICLNNGKKCYSFFLHYIIVCKRGAIHKIHFDTTEEEKAKQNKKAHNCKYQEIWPHAITDTPTDRCWQQARTGFWLALILSYQLCEKMHMWTLSKHSADQLSYSILMDCECPTECLKKLLRNSLPCAKNNSENKPNITSWVMNTR